MYKKLIKKNKSKNKNKNKNRNKKNLLIIIKSKLIGIALQDYLLINLN